MTSTSYQSGGNILLEFNAGFDPDQALLDTREQVDRAKSELPDDADEPKVSEVNISLFPILVVSISGDASEFLLKKISNDLKDKIQSLPNVLEVEIGGEREEQLDIIIDQNKIEAYGLNLNEILSFVRSNNQVVSAGNLDTGDQIVLAASASLHRKAAFESTAFMMDYLKTSPPFWKFENLKNKKIWVDSKLDDELAAKKWSE